MLYYFNEKMLMVMLAGV